jgi:hypothetical protein
MTKDEIFIDANRSDEEPDRLVRLGILRDILVYHEHYFLEDEAQVTRLYDHKGTLTVTWSRKPTEEQRELVDGFWDSVFSEPDIEHVVGR